MNRKNKNDNPIYYATHAILDSILWFCGESELDELFHLHHVLARLKRAEKKLKSNEYITLPIHKLIHEITVWRKEDNRSLDWIDKFNQEALEFYTKS